MKSTLTTYIIKWRKGNEVDCIEWDGKSEKDVAEEFMRINPSYEVVGVKEK